MAALGVLCGEMAWILFRLADICGVLEGMEAARPYTWMSDQILKILDLR